MAVASDISPSTESNPVASPQAPGGLFTSEARSHWIRLRTLIALRWAAIAGQSLALAVADYWIGLDLQLGLCALVVGASVLTNLIALFVYPENKRLSETEAILILMFDLSQLSLLLALTGGLHNPFALLLLAPVTIAATTLKTRATIVMVGAAVLLVSAIAVYHVPLLGDDGAPMRQPAMFVFGAWVALVIGMIFLSVYARRVTTEVHSMAEALAATQMALAREQKLTDLGGVVAAAAHELGTPLATIKLVSVELMEELSERPDLYDDAALIRDQADRCRDILRSMGRAGKDDLQMRVAPLGTVIREAAEPHADRGKDIEMTLEPMEDAEMRQPTIRRRPEIIHGIRNLVQNAVDFSAETVWIEARWSRRRVTLRILDDGPGFPPHLIGRIGDPFVGRRRTGADGRPEYEGMGLGLFIAKTLLERTGAELSFANAGLDHGGAVVEVAWPRSAIEVPAGETGSVLGENQRFEV